MLSWNRRAVTLATATLLCCLCSNFAAAENVNGATPAVASTTGENGHGLAYSDARTASAKFTDSWMELIESLASQLGTHTPYERARPPPKPEFTPSNLFPNTSIAVTSMESCVPSGIFLLARYMKENARQVKEYNLLHVQSLTIPRRKSRDPEGIWHGTRYPARGDAERIKKMKEAGDEGIGFLKFFREMDTGILHAIGIEEMRSLGKRMAAMFPTLFKYHPLKVKINSSPVHRASMSAAAFSQGAFNYTPTALVTSGNVSLRPFDDCDSYKQHKKQRKKPIQADHVTLLDNFAKNLNTTGSRLWDLWKICQYQLSLRADLPPSVEIAETGIPACMELLYYSQIQEEKDPDLLSFLRSRSDFEIFSLKGENEGETLQAGKDKVNIALASPIIKSAVDTLLGQEISLNFAHVETLLPFACLLGLCGGEDGMGNQDGQKALDFWPSWLSPFGANIAMIRLECDVQGEDAEAKNHLPIHLGSTGKIMIPASNISFSKSDLTAPPLTSCSWPWLNCDPDESGSSSDLAKRESSDTVAEQKSAVEFKESVSRTDSPSTSKKSFVAILHNELFVGLPDCGNMLLCPMKDFQLFAEKRIAEYNAARYCPIGINAVVSYGSTKLQEFFKRAAQLVSVRQSGNRGSEL